MSQWKTNLRPSADWVWDCFTQGSRLGHPRATQAPRKGLPSVEWNNWFCLQQKLEKRPGGCGRAERAYRRNRAGSPTSRVIGKSEAYADDIDQKQASRSTNPGVECVIPGVESCKSFGILIEEGEGVRAYRRNRTSSPKSRVIGTPKTFTTKVTKEHKGDLVIGASVD